MLGKERKWNHRKWSVKPQTAEKECMTKIGTKDRETQEKGKM